MGVTSNPALTKRYLFGNYTIEEDLHRRPLSKLTKDIMDQFGIVKIVYDQV